MDLIVKPASQERAWDLTDLLGRYAGQIVEMPPGKFIIKTDKSGTPIAGVERGPHASLDDALAQIEKHTHASCRRSPD